MKRCVKCKQFKEESEFYKQKVKRKNGIYNYLMNECKKCHIEYSKKHYYKNVEKRKAYSWEYYHKDIEKSRAYARKVGKKTRQKIEYRKKQAEYYRIWYKTRGRKRTQRQKELVKFWRELNPEKCKVYKLVELALKSGKIKKPKHCSICMNEQKLVAHHDDYKFLFKVRWLCYSCHKLLHKYLKD